MTWPIVCGLLFVLVAVISAIQAAREAPEGWECPRCRGEVLGPNVCPWCGFKPGEASAKGAK